MTKLVEVVFCVDCDRNLETYRSAVGDSGGSPTEGPPRRMAIKKDPNGDPLCVLCMDARRAKRNAAFLVRTGRAQDPVLQPGLDNAPSGEAPRRAIIQWAPKVLPIQQAPRVPSSENSRRAVGKAKKTTAKSGTTPPLSRAHTARSTAKKTPVTSKAAISKHNHSERVRVERAERSAALNEVALRRLMFRIGITRCAALLAEIKREAGRESRSRS